MIDSGFRGQKRPGERPEGLFLLGGDAQLTWEQARSVALHRQLERYFSSIKNSAFIHMKVESFFWNLEILFVEPWWRKEIICWASFLRSFQLQSSGFSHLPAKILSFEGLHNIHLRLEISLMFMYLVFSLIARRVHTCASIWDDWARAECGAQVSEEALPRAREAPQRFEREGAEA